MGPQGAHQPQERHPWGTDWDQSLEGVYFSVSITVTYGAGTPRSAVDLIVKKPGAHGPERKTSVWAEPPETRPATPHNALLALVNVINAAERDYWVDYLARKQH